MMGLRTIIAAPLALVALAGCDDGQVELRAWMDETRKNTPVVVDKVPPPKTFAPFRYGANADVEPFSQAKLKVAAPTASRAGSLLQPDPRRAKEPLEAFPLDNLKMVGNLRQGGANVALLQAEAALYPVRVGNYIGTNSGRVLRISESEVSIRELVQDAAGDWVERDTALRLQESKK